MTKPTIAAYQPAPVDLEQGKRYFFCVCGLSAKQPFCDGSHDKTEFRPQAFVAEKTGRVFLCQCKQTRNAPYCDGTHNTLETPDV